MAFRLLWKVTSIALNDCTWDRMVVAEATDKLEVAATISKLGIGSSNTTMTRIMAMMLGSRQHGRSSPLIRRRHARMGRSGISHMKPNVGQMHSRADRYEADQREPTT